MITAHTGIIPPVKSVIGKYGMTIHTEYESLHSIKVIKKAIAETRNTVFIRKAFNRLINDWGPPALILLDYRVDLGSDSLPDPDKRKLVRTFFISYIILSRKAEFDNLSANFIFLADTEDLPEVRKLENDPVKILDILETTNEDINNMMLSIRRDSDQFKRIFNLKVLPVERVHQELDKTVADLLRQSAGLRQVRTSNQNNDVKSPTQLKSESPDSAQPAAMVIFPVDDKKAYVNNKPVNIEKNKSLMNLSSKQFYIIGRCESKNQSEVAKIIRHAIRNGFENITFSTGDEIVINMSNNCTIDSTTISLLVDLLTHDLAGFKNKTINVSFKNACILEKSTGYFMIKKYIHHEY